MFDIRDKYRKLMFPAALLTVILFGFLLRLAQAKIGLPYIYYWDEPDIASRAIRMLQTGDMNPHFFNYGTLMLYLSYFADVIYLAFVSILPADSSLYIANVADIKTTYNSTGWHWTISHPEIYYWNRTVIALMGVASVVVVYLIGKNLYNRWVGLLAATLLAVLPVHIEHSAMITPNVTAVLFMLCVVYFSMLYIRDRKQSSFIIALVFVGLAIATKYNAGLAVLMPLFALAWIFFSGDKSSVTRWHWLAALVLPAIVVMLVMPYMLLDFPRFIMDVLIELTHYGRGHRGYVVAAGWEHFSLQMGRVYNNVGLVIVVLAIFGVIAGRANRMFIFVLIFPVLYILYMSSTVVPFHRNFLLIYPFLTICAAVGAYHFYVIFNSTLGSGGLRKFKRINLIVPGLIVLLVAVKATHAYQDASRAYTTKDTRSDVIATLNKLDNVSRVVIAKELMLHQHDLDMLKLAYTVEPLDIMAASKKSSKTVYLIPALVTAQYATKYRIQERKHKQTIIDSVPESDVLEIVGILPDRTVDLDALFLERHAEMSAYTKLDIFSINPTMLIVKGLPTMPLDPSLITFDVCEYPDYPTIKDHLGVIWLDDGVVQCPMHTMGPGKYAAQVDAKSYLSDRVISKSINMYGFSVSTKIEKIKLYKLDEKIRLAVFSSDKLLAEKVFSITADSELLELPFNLSSRSNIRVTITYVDEVSDHTGRSPVKLKELSIVNRDDN